jgi:tetratricopeptide (TPR) repeat protein
MEYTFALRRLPGISTTNYEQTSRLTDIKIARQLFDLSTADYRVRGHVADCLKIQASSHPCENCKLNAAFQIGLCYNIGFGFPLDENQALLWLEKSKRQANDFEIEMETARSIVPDRSFKNGRVGLLGENGFLNRIDYANEYRKLALSRKIESQYLQEIQDMQKSLGEGHRVVIVLKSILVSILIGKGDFERSEALMIELLEELESNPACGPGHTNTLTISDNLALVLQYQSKYKEAEEMNKRTLGWKEEVLGREHPHTLISVHNLAMVLQYQGKYEAAQEMNQRALDGLEKVLGKEHPHTLMSASNLAAVLVSKGEYEVAEKINQQVVDRREKVLGKEHPDTLSSISNLAKLLQHQGKYEAAEEMSRQALEKREKVLGKEHPDTLASSNNLASVLNDQGKYEAAEEMY